MQKNEIIKNLSIPQKILIKNSKKKNNNNNYPNLTNSNKIKTKESPTVFYKLQQNM